MTANQSSRMLRLQLGAIAIGLIAAISSIAPIQAADADDSSVELGKALTAAMEQTHGLCAVLGCDDQMSIEIARASQLLVHVRAPQADRIADLRTVAAEAGYGLDRFSATVGTLASLPFADNMIDVVLVTQASQTLLDEVSASELLRVLRPEGIAIIGKAVRSKGPDVSQKDLANWASASKLTPETPAGLEQLGTWIQLRKPLMENVGEWTHWEHGPDNNPVSKDSVIQAPYMTQFMADPKYIGMPSITTAAGGRTFLAIGHIAHHRREWETLYQLIARNGYNGTVLWQRQLPEGYLVHRSAFIATRDAFYMINGDHALILDPATGTETGEIRLPNVPGNWKWMVKKGDMLYVLVGKPDQGVQTIKGDRAFGGWSWADLSRGYYGPRVPFGYGNTIAAYDLEKKQIVWKHEESASIDSRAMAMTDGKVFLHCPDKLVRCLDEDTGQVLWTNEDPEVQKLIAEPGKKLISTPGFKTQCLSVATPKALIIQGQTRMNVIALSTDDGYLLWQKKKVTNNPNAIYVDDKVILGVGEHGRHVVLDPVTGKVEDDLKFNKVSCTRLTASADSLFCRGEGTLRFDRKTKQVLIDSAQRAGCNDGAIPAHGLLYLGPWQCDCNLSLIGLIAKCSAGEFTFDHLATDAERLHTANNSQEPLAKFAIDERDWPTYRSDNSRSASSQVEVSPGTRQVWSFVPKGPFVPTCSTTAGGLVFMAGNDGKVRAVDATNGQLRWEFATAGPIMSPPTIWDGRAFVGSGDGYVYSLEAASGRLLWRFQAAPLERQIMIYGSLSSTWPVNTGVMIHDGIAYFGAGIIDQDGTYIYALDANTGKIKWQNNSSGILNPRLRKGVSAQGNLSVLGDQLLLAGGNQVSPAIFDLQTGECRSQIPKSGGQPRANSGQFIGVFDDVSVIAGGRILYASPRNVSNKNSFITVTPDAVFNMNFGGVPPAWDNTTMALVNFKHGKLTALDVPTVSKRFRRGLQTGPDKKPRSWLDTIATTLESEGAVRWQNNLNQPAGFEVVALAVCSNAVVATLKFHERFRARSQWFVVGFRPANGQQMFRQELPQEPLPGGLTIDRDGRVLVTALNGAIAAYGK